MKCKVCGDSIVIFECSGVYVLDKPYRGFTYVHTCGTYKEMLSKYMLNKLGLEDNPY